MHVKVVDNVGNIGYATDAVFKYDSVAPYSLTATFSADAYTSTNASVNISAADTTSGMGPGAKMRITGDITNGTATDA